MRSATPSLRHARVSRRANLTRIVRLAFLALAVTDAILKGRQRRRLTVKTVRLEGALPVRWSEQRRCCWVWADEDTLPHGAEAARTLRTSAMYLRY